MLNVFFWKEILIHYRWKVTFDAVTSLMCTIYVFFLCPAKQTIPSSEYGTTTAILQFHCRNNSSQGSSCNMKAETAVMLTYFSFYMNHFFFSMAFLLLLNLERNEMIFCCSAAEKKEDHSISAGILLPQHLFGLLSGLRGYYDSQAFKDRLFAAIFCSLTLFVLCFLTFKDFVHPSIAH